jgi:hypothetical protein
MANIAPHLNDHDDLSVIYQGIYKYCFPPDFKEKLRLKYLRKSQGDLCVQDYFAELAQLWRRLSEVTDAQHVQWAWDGAAKYIKVKWAIKGILPENTTIEELRETTLDIERAQHIVDSIDLEGSRRKSSKWERSRSPNRRQEYKCERSYKEEGKPVSHARAQADNWKKNTYMPSKMTKSNLTDKQRDEYRATNKCFQCSETGHMVKDCPKRQKARPSRLSSNAATVKSETKVCASSALLKELDKLAKAKESIESASVRVNAAEVRRTTGTSKKPTRQNHIERNAMRVKDLARKVPNTLVVQASIEGESVHILLDTGSQADLMSTTLVDQLKLAKVALTKPLQLQLAMSGSRGTLHHSVNARLVYQDVDERRDFDVGNIDNYDVILGMPWLFQHSVCLSFNPSSVFIGSKQALPMEGSSVIQINSISTNIFEAWLEELREMLHEEAGELCKTVSETPLPPFRAINHIIPTIDNTKVYRFRPSRCPEALKPLFEAKAQEYIKSGWWKLATGENTIPMLFLPKRTKDGTTQLRTVLDKREQNANTKKLASPLPNIEDILATVSCYKYKTLLDGKDEYEQIHVDEKDVHKTLFHTPMGTMVSLVMQQGDCNAGATYQGLMNHLFAEHIGIFMFVYLDDIIIFSNSIEEHVSHIRMIFKILEQEKFYLSPRKMQFFTKELSILGHLIDEKGIKMDPNKVDSISKWKTPTTKEQLTSYLGALGYLAPNCPGIRVPMSILSKHASGTKAFRWEGTEEHAFRETQRIVEDYRGQHRVALRYRVDVPPIYLINDASLTGASGFVSQGLEWRTAPVATFWSSKFDSAQQNYPVHDREALAIVASLKKFQAMLQGIKFEILTDHKALEHLMTQKNLSTRQARWLDALSQLDFEIRYIEGTSNILADVLSRIYSEEAKGTEWAKSEYVAEESSSDDIERENRIREEVTKPLVAGLAAAVAMESGITSEGVRRNPARAQVAPRRYNPEIPGREGDVIVEKRLRKPRPRERSEEIVREPQITHKEDHMINDQAGSDSEEVQDSPASAEPEGESTWGKAYANIEKAKAHPLHIARLVSELDIIKAIHEGYGDDKQFGKIMLETSHFPNYELRDGLLYMIEHEREYLCVPNN